ncbi:MAG: hypothetical protein ACOYXM_16455, partial [Actinomycetota bacterium]
MAVEARGSQRRFARWAALRGAAALLVWLPLVALAEASPAGAACAAPSAKQLGGTLLGEDGRYVSALIGVELFDSSLRSIDANGCVQTGGTGYSHLDRVNETGANGCCFLLDHNGATSGSYESTWDATRYNGPIPANAAFAWIEVYPESKTEGPNGNSPSYRRYGGIMRRFVPLSGNLNLRLPLGCGLGTGGDNGSIEGRVLRNGSPVGVNQVLAWSRAPDGPSPIMGFGVQPGRADGTFSFLQASPGQSYGLLLETSAGAFWVENDYGPGISVAACRATRLSIDVGFSPPRVKPLVGKDTVGVRRADQVLLTNTSSGGAATAQYTVGQAGDKVVVGDWNGDGIDTVGLRRGSQFLLTDSVDGSGPFTTFSYGLAGDTPVAGDWDGNGTDTIGIRRGNSYYLRNTNSGGNAHITFAYGTATDTPVTGDWDGNGTDTPGIRRSNSYYLRNTNSSGNAHI